MGGRSNAAVARAARLGDGWLGIWVSPRRFAAVCDRIGAEADQAGRTGTTFEHALNVWCGFASTPDEARQLLADRMQTFYHMPFEPFERYSPHGTPEDVAAFLQPYVEASCTAVNVIPCAADDDQAVAAVGELRALLSSELPMSRSPPATSSRGSRSTGLEEWVSNSLQVWPNVSSAEFRSRVVR